MEFHPSQIPITETFEVKSEDKVPEVVSRMITVGFGSQKGGFRVIMTKDKNTAKKIGFTLMNELNFGLRKAKQERDVRYWIFNHDEDHFAMVLISSKVFSSLGF